MESNTDDKSSEEDKKKYFDEYYKAVKYCADHKLTETFGNSGEYRAIAVFMCLFEYAKEKVRVFSENLCSEIPNSYHYLESLESFVKRTGGISILLERIPNEEWLSDKPVFGKLRALKNEGYKIEVKQTDARATYGDSEINFATADDSAYRIEYDKKNKIARWNFNDTPAAKRLNDLFDKHFSTAKDVSL